MKFIKLLVLVAAASIGMLYYNRYHAVMNVAGNNLLSGEDSGGFTSGGLLGSGAGRGNRETRGGIGPVGGAGDMGMFSSGGTPGQGLTASSPRSTPSAQKKPAVDMVPLLKAAFNGDKDQVTKLLGSKIPVDGRDDHRRTALMYASWNGHDALCATLLSAGAHIQFQDMDGNTAYDYAAGRGLTDTVQFLLKQTYSADDNHYVEYATLIRTAYAGDPVYLPAGKGRLASVNRITPEGQSPLHIAANNGSVALMEALIKRGAKVNLENDVRQTPLHWAAWNNQTAAMALLLDKGATISAQDIAGDTPLTLSTQSGHLEAVKLLLARGADRTLTNKQGKTALMIATGQDNAALADLLR